MAQPSWLSGMYGPIVGAPTPPTLPDQASDSAGSALAAAPAFNRSVVPPAEVPPPAEETPASLTVLAPRGWSVRPQVAPVGRSLGGDNRTPSIF